eukprot:TRINITY_DN16023_c0_g1_i3.p3 TRINITY_DN16023_c0_g1~~TRINITY_DN16023_c0_g1_i3.p3  ORF type:complete len:122 (-),score=29.62 TRINITY_DN16023_c0_g1_i3:91-456(-)
MNHREKLHAEEKLQVYMRDKGNREEEKKSRTEDKQMMDHSAKIERQHQDREAAKKAQLRQIQEENRQAALAKKNKAVQDKVYDSLKEGEMIKKNPFNAESNDTRCMNIKTHLLTCLHYIFD